MLDEDEWALLAPHLNNSVQQIKDYRERTGCTLAEATAIGHGQEALAMYAQMTGFTETNVNALYHHRRSIYGADCTSCGKPLRTPRASYCVACGTPAAKLHE